MVCTTHKIYTTLDKLILPNIFISLTYLEHYIYIINIFLVILFISHFFLFETKTWRGHTGHYMTNIIMVLILVKGKEGCVGGDGVAVFLENFFVS